MNQNKLKQITENITTKQELVYLLDDISQAKDLIYKQSNKKLSEKVKNVVSEDLRKIIKNQEGNLNTREEQEEFLNQLKSQLQSVPQIKLTLAFSPSDSFLNDISQWLENETGEHTIIDLTVNPEIVGGAIIEYDGHYLNFGLDKKIEKINTHE